MKTYLKINLIFIIYSCLLFAGCQKFNWSTIYTPFIILLITIFTIRRTVSKEHQILKDEVTKYSKLFALIGIIVTGAWQCKACLSSTEAEYKFDLLLAVLLWGILIGTIIGAVIGYFSGSAKTKTYLEKMKNDLKAKEGEEKAKERYSKEMIKKGYQLKTFEVKCPSCQGSTFCGECGRTGICKSCGGSGYANTPSGKCYHCNGNGRCPACGGKAVCNYCKGRGTVYEEKWIK